MAVLRLDIGARRWGRGSAGGLQPLGRFVVAKEDRGFASMDRTGQRGMASKGGKAAHQKGSAHEWTSEEAREAGRKGGMASHRRKLELRSADAPSDPDDVAATGVTGSAALSGTDDVA